MSLNWSINSKGVAAELTMLMKAERKTRMMVKIPTRVLFIRDWTIFLERFCRDTGKNYKRKSKDDVHSSWIS